MKFRHQIFRGLPVVMLVCGVVPAPAEAQFTQQAELVGTGGNSVSLSGDGNTAILGEYGDTGAARVFTRSGGAWSQQGPELVGTDIEGGSPGEVVSVSLSRDGNTAIIGGIGDNNNTGAAWIFTRSDGIWTQQGPKLVGTGAVGAAWQGFSVGLSGDGNSAIIGGPADNSGFGAAWVFARSGGVWSQQGAKLVGGLGQGVSVSLSGDGNTAIVGAFEDGSVGAALVYTRSSTVWSQQAKLVGTGAIGFAGQGVSVSLSDDGNTAIVGGPDDNTIAGVLHTGAAWVFTRVRGAWSQQGPKLVGTGVTGPFLAEQGYSVSLSGDGGTAIVGGPADDTDTGAAWVFTRLDGMWSQEGSKVVGTGAVGAFGELGYSVSLSSDAATAIVGSLLDAAWVFTQPVFAGTPGKANCHGQSVSALARQYGGLNSAAAALGYSDVSALQSAIMAFCGG
jgi:hypothetical protein